MREKQPCLSWGYKHIHLFHSPADYTKELTKQPHHYQHFTLQSICYFRNQLSLSSLESQNLIVSLLRSCLLNDINLLMQFGPLSTRQAIDNRFKEMRAQSRQEILAQIYGKNSCVVSEQKLEKDISETFSALLENFDFDMANPIVVEISRLFKINLDTIRSLEVQQRSKLVYEKIYNQVEDSMRIVQKIAENSQNTRTSVKSIQQESSHFQWMGVSSKYTHLRPIFEEILLEKVKLFDKELTQMTQLPETLPYDTVEIATTARDGFDTAKSQLFPSKTGTLRSKTVSTSLLNKRVKSNIEPEFTNVKIRDRSQFKLSKWTKSEEDQFLHKKAFFRSNLKINNIPVLFQFVKKYTLTVKARDNIYRKWEQREKLGISPEQLRYLCATSLFLNKTMAKTEKTRIKNNIKAAGSNLVSRLELNIAEKIIETYHQLMKKVSDLRAKYYIQLTEQRKLQQKQSSKLQQEKAKQSKKQMFFRKYKKMFETIVNSDRMKLRLNTRVYTWVKLFITNLKRSIGKPLQKVSTPDVVKRLTTQTDENTLIYKHKMKYPSAKIIKREDQYSHRLKYRKYIPSERFHYDKKFQQSINSINKVRLNRNHSHSYYKQLTGGPTKRQNYISVDLSKKKVFLSSPNLIKYIVRIQAKWKAVFTRMKFLNTLQQQRQKRQLQFQDKVQSLYKIYPLGKKIDMRVVESRLKRVNMKISNLLRPYERAVRRPINVFTSFCLNKLGNVDLKSKYSRNGAIRIGQFRKLVESNQYHLLKKSGLVVTSKEINDCCMRNGTNPMWWAVYHSNLELTTLFLQGGGDPNSKDNEGQSCLHIAIKNGAVPIIFILLDYGGDLNRKNSRKVNCLFYASSRMLKLLGLQQGNVAGDKDVNATFYRRTNNFDVYKEHYF